MQMQHVGQPGSILAECNFASNAIGVEMPTLDTLCLFLKRRQDSKCDVKSCLSYHDL